jgi:hypothetical protein
VITPQQFQVVITSMNQLLEFSKTLSPSALVLAWDTFPEPAKTELTESILLYAVQQWALDLERQKDLPIHIQLLRYIYPVRRITKEKRGQEFYIDEALLEGGLRRDLAQRMARPYRFHETAPVRDEVRLDTTPRLPEGAAGNGPPWLRKTEDERRAHLQEVIQAVKDLRASGVGSGTWTPIELNIGRSLFKQVLMGAPFLTRMKIEPVAAWVLRNGQTVDRMLQEALEGEPAKPSAERLMTDLLGPVTRGLR